MTLLEKVEVLIREEGVKLSQFSARSGIPRSTIDNWWKKGIDNIRLPTFRTLCSYFGVTMDSMAYDDKDIEYKADTGQSQPLTRDERRLVEDFSKLDGRGKSAVLDTVERELSYSNKDKTELLSDSQQSA